MIIIIQGRIRMPFRKKVTLNKFKCDKKLSELYDDTNKAHLHENTILVTSIFYNYVSWIFRDFQGDASAFGDYQCNVPQRTLELFFHKTVEFDPSFVIFSGLRLNIETDALKIN